MKRAIFIAVFFVLFSQVCEGQWKKIYQFDKAITSVYFTSFDTSPLHGFVGTDGYEVFQTYDGGLTWTKSILIQSQVPPFGNSFSFTFKNRLEGWFCTIRDAIECVSKTTDGGSTWYALPNTAFNTAVYYLPSTNLLISPYFDPGNVNLSMSISTDGTNFTQASLPGVFNNPTIGIAFSDDYHGILSTDHIYGKTLYTTDGGLTWQQSQMIGESFQPLAIKGTLNFYMIRETSAYDDEGSFFRSTDGGINWIKTYQYTGTKNPSAVTGTVEYGTDHALFFQTIQKNSEGIMMSLDTGYTFYSLCGPTNGLDTRFYVRDTFIYAGDGFGGLWLNTTGIGSNSTPQLSKNSIFLTSKFCNVKEDTITITLFDSCSGRQATLLEASLSGSNRFSVASGAVPRTIVPNDTVHIIYTPDPNTSATENATLSLKLKLGWKIFDTVITLTGRNITPHLDISLTPVLKTNNLVAGETAECNIFSSNRIQDRGLDKVTFDLTYDNDLLEVASITAQSGLGATYSAPIVTNGIARLPITITGNNMTIDSLLPMVSVKFRTFLTDTTISTIELSSITLNDDNPDYKNCTLSATGNSTTFTQASICGDSTIRSFMLTGKLIDILSIRPNPTSGDATISFTSFTNNKALLQLLDELGKVVLEETLSTKRGANEHTIAIPKHWSGTFYLRLQMGKDVVTGKFVKQ